MKRYLKYILLMALPVTLFGLNDTALLIYYYGQIGWYNTNIGTPSLNVGSNNISTSQNSAAVGSSLQNYQPNNLTAGQYNASVTGDLFNVGNGLYSDPLTGNTTRKNALSVSGTGTGTVTIPGTVEITAVERKGGIANFAGSPPAWWSSTDYGFLDPGAGADAVNAPANIGQLKNVAIRCKFYLDSKLEAIGGAGSDIRNMCTFVNVDNYAPVSVGQLKNVARVFYNRLARCGYNWQNGSYGTPTTPYPWAGTIHTENGAPATIGQIKRIFALDVNTAFLTQDDDGDGMPSYWEKAHDLEPLIPATAGQDSNRDGSSDLTDYLGKTDPNRLMMFSQTYSVKAWYASNWPVLPNISPVYKNGMPLAYEREKFRSWMQPDGTWIEDSIWIDSPVTGWPQYNELHLDLPIPPVFDSLKQSVHPDLQCESDATCGARGADWEGQGVVNARRVWLRSQKRDADWQIAYRITRSGSRTQLDPPISGTIYYGPQVSTGLFTFPANSTYSNPVDLIPRLDTPSPYQLIRPEGGGLSGPEMTTSRLELLVVPGSNPAAAGRLLGVTFSGDPQSPAQFIPVKTDAGNEFVAPQWRDDNGDGVLTGNDHTYPVAYIRNTKPMVSGKFELKPATVVWIKANAVKGSQLLSIF